MKQQQQKIQQEQAVDTKLAQVTPQDNPFVALGFVNVASAGVRSDTSQINYGEAFIDAVRAGTEAYKATDKYRQGALRDEVRGAQDARARLFNLNREMEEQEVPFDQRDKYLVNALEQDISNQGGNSDFYADAYIGDVNKGVAQMSNLAAINHEAELDNAQRSLLKEQYELGKLDISTYTKQLSIIEGVKQANQDVSTMLSAELTTSAGQFAVGVETFLLKTTNLRAQVGREVAEEIKKSGKSESEFFKDKTYKVKVEGVETEKPMTLQQYTDARFSASAKSMGLADPLVEAERRIKEALEAKGSDGSTLINLNTPAAIALKGAIRNMGATVASHVFNNTLDDSGSVVPVSQLPTGAQEEAKERIKDSVERLTTSVLEGRINPALLQKMEMQMGLNPTVVSEGLALYAGQLNNILAKTMKEEDPAETRKVLNVISNQAGAFSDHALLNQGVRANLSPEVKAGLLLLRTGVNDTQLQRFVRLSTTTVSLKEFKEAGINVPFITEELIKHSDADHLTLSEKSELSKIIGITIKAHGTGEWWLTPLWGVGDRLSVQIISNLFPKAPPATEGFVQGMSRRDAPPLVRSLHFGATQVRAYDSSHRGSLNKGISWHINNTPQIREALIARHSFKAKFGKGEVDKGSEFYKKFKDQYEWTSKEIEVEIVPNKMEEGKGLHTMYIGYKDTEGDFNKDSRFSVTLSDKELMEIARKGTSLLQPKRRGN